MSGLETEEIRAPVFACGRHCCFLCLVIAFGDPGQVQGTGPGRRTFCNEVSLEVASLCKQASPVVLGSRARLSWAILPLGLSENLNQMATYMNEME